MGRTINNIFFLRYLFCFYRKYLLKRGTHTPIMIYIGKIKSLQNENDNKIHNVVIKELNSWNLSKVDGNMSNNNLNPIYNEQYCSVNIQGSNYKKLFDIYNH